MSSSIYLLSLKSICNHADFIRGTSTNNSGVMTNELFSSIWVFLITVSIIFTDKSNPVILDSSIISLSFSSKISNKLNLILENSRNIF